MKVAAWESLHKATLELARSTSLKQRLTDAFKRHLLDLPVAALPGEMRQEFEALRLCMTRVRPAYGECAVAATVRKMSIGEADACAARIVGMLDCLHRIAELAPENIASTVHARGTSETGTSRVPTLISVNRA